MPYNLRNILFAFLVLVFFVLTTVFSLSASGYRVSLSALLEGKSFIQKTGILAVNSKPAGAQVVLNKQYPSLFSDEEVLGDKNITTPYKIRNLLPGDYLLTFNLKGYWPWQQKVSIYPGQTTYLEEVVLFKKDRPIIFFNSERQKIELDSRGQKIILASDHLALDLSSGQALDLEGEVSDLSFLGDRKILVNGDSIFDYAKNKYLFLDDLDLNRVERIKIKNGDLYYLDQGLNRYDFFSRKNEKIIAEAGISDYDFNASYYYLLFSRADDSRLKIYSYHLKELIRDAVLPSGGDYEILSPTTSGNFVYVYDRNFKTLYILNLSSKFNSFWAVLNEVDQLNFIDATNFVYSSGLEIYSYNSFLAEKFLIGRFDSVVSNLIWHPKNYLIYSTDRDIVALDLKHDKYSIKLLTLDEIGHLVLDRLGGVLYFTGRLEDQSGVFKLLIQ